MQEIRSKIDLFYTNKEYEQAHNFMINRLTMAIKNDEPLIILNLLCELMSYYRVHAKFEQGNIMASRTAQIIEMLGQEESILAATAYLNIATLYRVEGLYDKSLEFFEKCYDIYKKSLNERDVQFISFYNNISLLYQEIGEIKKAIEYSEKALSLILTIKDAEIEIAITYTNLSQMYFEIYDKEKGEDLLNKALQLFEKYGENDPHYFAVMASNAQYHFLNKNYTMALDLYQKVLENIEKTFGKNADYQRVYQNYLYVKNHQNGLGMKLCSEYYHEIGKPMIDKKFPQLVPFIATGLVGMGSECLGYDDEISRDHDFGPGFCIWLPKEQYVIYAQKLQEAYDDLPSEFHGYKRLISEHGQGRVGVFEIENFFKDYLCKLPETENDWLILDEQSLLILSSGEVFEDNWGEFTKIRKSLQQYYPEKVRIKKIIHCIAKMSQSGQYNYPRLQKRGDIVASSLALNEFIVQTMACIFLLNRRYKPYYKWTFHALQSLPILNNKVYLIQKLLECENNEKQEIIEEICKSVASELKKQNLTKINSAFLQDHIPYLQSLED